MYRVICILYLLFSAASVQAQFESRMLETDSSYIDITKNATYKFVEETLKEKDSIKQSVYFIEDTMQLAYEGWRKDNGNRFGTWSFYRSYGELICAVDYDKHAWQYNQKLFTYQSLKDNMRKRADTLIMNKFGKQFFRKNVHFDFEGYTYVWSLEQYAHGEFYERIKLGDYITPIRQRPDGYVFNYSIQLSPVEKYNNYLRIELDSLGNVFSDTTEEVLNFTDRIVTYKRPISISRNVAFEICKNLELEKTEFAMEGELKYGWLKEGQYPGELYYEVTQLYKERGDINQEVVITQYFNVWRINPWTGEVFFRDRLKKLIRSSDRLPITGKFIALDE